MSQSSQQLRGERFVVRQQLFTVRKNFDVTDARGALAMSAKGSGLRVMDKIELLDQTGKPVLEVKQRPGARPHVDVLSNGKKLVSIGERRVGVKDRFVIDTPLPTKFDVVGNVWSTRYTITIDGKPAAQVMMEPGLVKADTYDVIIAEGIQPRIPFGLILAIDILTHQGKR